MEYLQTEVRQLLFIVITKLVSYLYYSCHESVLEMIYLLLRLKINRVCVLNEEDVGDVVSQIFVKLEAVDDKSLFVAEKALYYSLNWSVDNKYGWIIAHFEEVVVRQYNELSFSALKCIKTYIQMVHPHSREDWQHIEVSLLHILQKVHLAGVFDLQL